MSLTRLWSKNGFVEFPFPIDPFVHEPGPPKNGTSCPDWSCWPKALASAIACMLHQKLAMAQQSELAAVLAALLGHLVMLVKPAMLVQPEFAMVQSVLVQSVPRVLVLVKQLAEHPCDLEQPVDLQPDLKHWSKPAMVWLKKRCFSQNVVFLKKTKSPPLCILENKIRNQRGEMGVLYRKGKWVCYTERG